MANSEFTSHCVDEAINNATHAATPSPSYRLVGDFWLSDPQSFLSSAALARLRELEPFLRHMEDEFRLRRNIATNFDLNERFEHFAKKESSLWDPPRCQDEVVIPSGSLNWPLAHHLHNPSFTTLTPHSGETADASNPCIWQIMANTYESGKTLIFDHLARREVDDGLEKYPKHILECHEEWLGSIRERMRAIVEICYGRAVEKRMLETLELEALPLWGEHANISIYLEWGSTRSLSRAVKRIIVFAAHTQIFCLPWGRKYAALQDRLWLIAHKMAGLSCKDNFFQNLPRSFLDKKFPRRHQYPQINELSQAARSAIESMRQKRKSPSTTLKTSAIRPGTWNAAKAMKNALSDPDVNSFLRSSKGGRNDRTLEFLRTTEPGTETPTESGIETPTESGAETPTESGAETPTASGTETTIEQSGNAVLHETDARSVEPSKAAKISRLVVYDPSKPLAIALKCRLCGFQSDDNQPRWHIKNGKYVAKKRRCSNNSCLKLEYAIPRDPSIIYVTYASVMTGISREGKSYFRPYLKPRLESSLEAQGSSILLKKLEAEAKTLRDLPEAVRLTSEDPSKPDIQLNPPRNLVPIPRKWGQQSGVDKGPFAIWHKRKIVLSSQGRVKLWVPNENGVQKPKVIEFSAYGSYLTTQEDKLIDFNARGISIILADGTVVWHKGLEDFMRVKKGDKIIEHHRLELEMQTREAENY